MFYSKMTHGKPKIVQLCILLLGVKTFSSFYKKNYSQNVFLFSNHPDEMCDGLTRLKSLGLGLQSEIDSQDDSIDSLLNKADKMDSRIHNTNQQMKKLK